MRFSWLLTPPVLIFPSLSLFNRIHRNRKEVVLGDDNSLSLTFNARNEGEGGAYEAELYVVLPPEADYSGIARNNEVTGDGETLFCVWPASQCLALKSLPSLRSQSLSQLTCSYDTENQTRFLSCDLGNPMKSGTNVRAHQHFIIWSIFSINFLRGRRRFDEMHLKWQSDLELPAAWAVVLGVCWAG